MAIFNVFKDARHVHGWNAS